MQDKTTDDMKKLILQLILMMLTTMVSAQKYVGGDISMLTKYEDAGVIYKDKGGNIVQPLTFFKEQGLNAMRVRLFVEPDPKKDKAVCQDINYVMALGKRIKDMGMRFMLDFHFSDTWADPSKQWTPQSWLQVNQPIETSLYNWTKAQLALLKANGAEPDFIQTGNEISYGMLWGAEGTSAGRCYVNSDANWDIFFKYLKAAGKACREECPEAKIIIHTERAAQPDVLTAYYDKMATAGIDYDIIGLSYYPAYHKSIQTLETALNRLESKNYGKDIMIVETGYSYAWPLNGTVFDYTATYPYTEEGQRSFTADLITMLNKHDSVKGLFWWWPEDNGNKSVTDSWWNAALYNHNTGQPYAALYELKNFANGSSGIDHIHGDMMEEGAWYSIDGRRLTGKPAAKGLYIHQGKKAVIR